jgi:hypothetical protein
MNPWQIPILRKAAAHLEWPERGTRHPGLQLFF